MLLSLVTGGISVLNASAFLLMTAGPELLEFIVVSSIYSMVGWLSMWLAPASIGYQIERLPVARLFQILILIVSSIFIFSTHRSTIGYCFIMIMVTDLIVFNPYILLFRSSTNLYVRTEFVRGVANSCALLATIFFLEKSPETYSILLLINSISSGIIMAVSGVHRPPSLRIARWNELVLVMGAGFWTRQLRALLLARTIDVGTLTVFSSLGMLAPTLSMKIGMAISQALSMNARRYRTRLLLAALMLVYAAGTGAILLLQDMAQLPVPDTFHEIALLPALLVMPLFILSFLLTLRGLRSRAWDAGSRC